MNNFKTILGIETSCDETAAAVLSFDSAQDKNGIQILSNVVASSKDLQSKYGGIIPEQAAREQLKAIIPVIKEALEQAKLDPSDLNAIAVTYGPGLIGSLLVGVETAKVLSLIWKKPLIPISHLLGHFYANWISPSPSLRDHEMTKQSSLNKIATPAQPDRDDKTCGTPTFPCIGLLVSGGHTDLVLFKNHGKYEYLGGTRDDAAGECFDKSARLLGLPYPGGPEISKLAEKGNPKAFKLPRPMIDSDDFDFSYSGLKTAVANLIQSPSVTLSPESMSGVNSAKSIYPSSETQDDKTLSDLCASIEQAIIDPLVKKTIRAAQKYGVEQIIVAGGVAANQKLISDFILKFKTPLRGPELKIELHVPPPNLCTDNGAMIASAAFFEKPINNPLSLQANPNLSLLS